MSCAPNRRRYVEEASSVLFAVCYTALVSIITSRIAATHLLFLQASISENVQQQEAAFHEVTEALQGNLTHLKREVTEHRDEILASDAALRAELANRLENLRKDCVESLALKDDEGVKVLLFVYF